jgi:hypothetical protein
MAEDRKELIQDEFRGSRIGVYGTHRNNPDEGRIFVWTKTGWFERIEGTMGNVAFTPIAESEDELRDLLKEDNPNFDLVQLGGSIKKTVTEEFRDQSTYLQEAPKDTIVEPTDEDEGQEYHQHDL